MGFVSLKYKAPHLKGLQSLKRWFKSRLVLFAKRLLHCSKTKDAHPRKFLETDVREARGKSCRGLRIVCRILFSFVPFHFTIKTFVTPFPVQALLLVFL